MLGVVGYLLFMAKFLAPFRYRSRGDAWQEFVYYLFPFILGCLVSWTYTYHMRKREFWIMAAIIAIISRIIMLYKNNDHYAFSTQCTYGGLGQMSDFSSNDLQTHALSVTKCFSHGIQYKCI